MCLLVKPVGLYQVRFSLSLSDTQVVWVGKLLMFSLRVWRGGKVDVLRGLHAR